MPYIAAANAGGDHEVYSFPIGKGAAARHPSRIGSEKKARVPILRKTNII
jgi:hypothetical protein